MAETAKRWFTAYMSQIADFFSSGNISTWDVIFAVLALVAGFVFGSLIKKAIRAVGRKLPHLSPTLITLLARIAKYFVILLGFGIALAFLGANLQPLLVGVIIVAVIATLALRGVASNFGAAIVLQSRRPIKVGDQIEILGNVGTVRDLNARAVVL